MFGLNIIMKYQLNYVEINITNVCNYSCTHCQSLNNFAFKGHQFWHEHQDQYKALSERIDIKTIQIIGGEPTLNPDFEKWVHGISSLWPDARLEIATNGSKLNVLNDTIYQVLVRNKGCLWVTCHDTDLYDNMLDFSKNFLDAIVSDNQVDATAHANWKRSYDSIKDESWPECDRIEQFDTLPTNIKKELIEVHQLNPKSFYTKTMRRSLTDKNGVEFRLDWRQSFVSSAITVVDQQQLKMKYNNDPVQAHDICNFKSCHQINKGKLYKCPLVSVLPDFLNQFDVDMNDNDRILAKSYIPITGLDNDDKISNFIKNIDKPIPQCKFCPVNNNNKHNFVGTDKKIKVITLQQH
jgi:organic radical activating enzyme